MTVEQLIKKLEKLPLKDKKKDICLYYDANGEYKPVETFEKIEVCLAKMPAFQKKPFFQEIGKREKKHYEITEEKEIIFLS